MYSSSPGSSCISPYVSCISLSFLWISHLGSSCICSGSHCFFHRPSWILRHLPGSPYISLDFAITMWISMYPLWIYHSGSSCISSGSRYLSSRSPYSSYGSHCFFHWSPYIFLGPSWICLNLLSRISLYLPLKLLNFLRIFLHFHWSPCICHCTVNGSPCTFRGSSIPNLSVSPLDRDRASCVFHVYLLIFLVSLYLRRISLCLPRMSLYSLI